MRLQPVCSCTAYCAECHRCCHAGLASTRATQTSRPASSKVKPQPSLCVLQELLPRIVALWHALHVPLVHRSRFYLAFQGREAFYFESEHRRLVYLAGQSSVDPGELDRRCPCKLEALEAFTPKPLPMS